MLSQVRSLIPAGTVEAVRAANPPAQVASSSSGSYAAPTPGMSTNVKLGLALFAAAGALWWWQRRK